MSTDRVRDWERSGTYETVLGRRIFVHRTGDDPAGKRLLLLLHGFPSSSFDWRDLLALEPAERTLTFDFLGFGLSEKPAGHTYSLHGQADLACALAAGAEVFLLAHDMGTSVATELLARDLAGELPFTLRGVLLLNGSMVMDAASPTLGQRLLRGRAGPLLSRFSSERIFRQQLGSTFSDAHPLTAAEAADQYALYTHAGGHRIAHRTIAYMDERMREAPRWHGAIRDWPGNLSFAWAMRDPVCTSAVLDALLALRPAAPLTRWPELGHYPQIEDPEAVLAALRVAGG